MGLLTSQMPALNDPQRGWKRHPAGMSNNPRDVALDRHQLLLQVAQPRHGVQQVPRVRVLGVVKDVPDGPPLHDPSRVHDADVIGNLRHQAEIVGNEYDRHVELLLQFLHEIDDLGLDRDVEGRRRLVGDQQRRIARQRLGDHGPLAHAAGILVRIAVDSGARVGNADLVEHVRGHLPGFLFRGLAVQSDDLANLVADGVERREGAHRLLEDHGDFVAAQLADGIAPRRQLRDIRGLVAAGCSKQDASPGDLELAGQQAQDGCGGDALAAAALAYQGQRLAGREGKADRSDDVDHPLIRGKGDLQIADFQQVFHRHFGRHFGRHFA